MSFTGMSLLTINSLTISGTTGSVTWTSGVSTLTISSNFVSSINVTTGVISINTSGSGSNIGSGKTLTISSSTTLTIGSGGIFTVNGILSTTSAATTPIVTGATTRLVVPSGGIVNYACGTSSATLPLINVQAGGILNVTGSNTITLSAIAMAGTLSISGTGSPAISTNGTAPVYAAGSTLIYLNCTAIPENAIAWTTGSNGPTNVTIDSPNGVTISSTSGRQITGTLTLASGALTLSGSSNTLTFNGTGSVAPIARTNGTITCTTSPSLNFSPTSAANWVIPSGTFTAAPTLTNLTVDMNTGGSLTLNEQDMTLTGGTYGFYLSSGLVILGSGNLQSAYNYTSSYSATSMVVTSATSGYFKHSFSTSSYQTFTFPIGDNVGTTEYSGFSFSLESNSVARVIGFKVVDATHPNMGTATNYLSRYWQSSLSVNTGTYTYTADLPYNGTSGDITGTETKLGVQEWNGSAWQGMSATVNTSSNYLAFSSATQSNAPLGYDITGRQLDNDDPCGAILLTPGSAGVPCSSATSGSTAGSTQTYSGCSGTADDDVWYKFTATAATHFVTVTGAASFDPVVQGYTLTSGTCPTATFTAISGSCTDATSGGGTTEVMALTGLTIGNTYYVRVYHYGSGSSTTPTFTICVTTPPVNDEPCGAVTLTPATSCNPTAADAAMASQTNTYASCDYSYTSPARDLWYKFVATATSHTIQATGNGTYDAVVQAYSGACGSLTAISGACADNTGAGGMESVQLSALTIGNTYYFRVYHGSSTIPTNTTYSVCVLSPPANDEPCSGTNVTAVTLTPGTTCTGTAGDASLASQTYPYGSCDYSYTSPVADVWYRFQATNTSHTVQVTGNGTYDPILTAYSATGSTCPVTLTAISGACIDATGAGGTETLQLSSLTVSNWYYVRVYHGSSTVPSNTTFSICVLSPPANDEPCNAIALTPGAICNPVTGSANLASQTFSYATCDYSYTSNVRDVWYKFTATNSTHIVRVAGDGDFDAVLQAYTGSSCSSLSAISGACADNTSGGGVETLTLTSLTIGTTYYVRVYHGSSTVPTTTTFDICVFSPPVNDAPCGAVSLTPASSCNPTTGDVSAATQTFSGCAGTANDDVWFQFVAAAATQVVTVVGSTSFDAVVQAYYAASCSALTASSNIGSCADATTGGGTETLTLTGLTVGNTYFVRVYDYYSGYPTTTSFTICIVTPPPPPANDDCPGTALTLCGTAVSGTTVNATQTLANYNGTYGYYDDDDVWYNFTASGTNALITLANTGMDGVLNLRGSGTCTAPNIQYRDFTGNAGTEIMRVSGLTNGATYKIRVFSFDNLSSSAGTFNISVCNTTYLPTLNDNVVNATTVSTGTTTGNNNASFGFEVGEPDGTNWGYNLDTSPTTVSNTQWFTFTPATSGSYGFNATQSSGIQAAIYTAPSAAAILTGGATQVISGSASGGTIAVSSLCLTGGTTYYIQLNGYMGSTGTPTLTITLNTPAVPVTTAATNVGCNSFTANWNAATSAGGYCLDVSDDNFATYVGTYNNLNVGNVTTYNVIGLTPGLTYKYRIRAFGLCAVTPQTANSNETTVVLLQASVGGTISGDTSFCLGGISGPLTLSGETGTIIKWQSSVSPFTTWTDISNTTNTYLPGLLTETTEFLAVVQNGTCTSANSAIATITINVPPAAPTGNAQQSLCSGATIADLLASGTSIQWYDSLTGGSLLPSITPLTDSTHYFASQTTGGCEGTNRFDVFVTLVPGLPADVSIVVDQNNICTGIPVTFTATPTNGGTPTYQWHLNSSTTGTGQASYTYSPVNGDHVYVTMNSSVNCATGNPATSDTIIMIIDNCTGIPTLSSNSSQVVVYPNPTNDRLFVNFDKVKAIPETMKIYNTFGQLCFETHEPLQINKNGIDVSHLSPGTYTLQIVFENGIVNKTIIKK